MDISIIIVSWNTKDILRDCLDSVYAQTQGVDYEVIVIDNNSHDGSARMVADDFPEVILIENEDNRGFAAANNQGMQIAKGQYILLLNSDTIVLDGAIQKTLSFAGKNEKVAVIGCKILNKDMTLQPSCFMFPSILNLILSSLYFYKLFPRNKFFAREKMGYWQRDDVRDVDVVTGCFMLVRRNAIDQVGLFDEDYFIYAEETDWCWRFKKAGWKNRFYPDAEIIHLGGQSSKIVRTDMILQIRKSLLLFFKKNYAKSSYRIAALLMSIFFILRVPYWLVKSLFISDRKFCLQTAEAYLKGFWVTISMCFKG